VKTELFWHLLVGGILNGFYLAAAVTLRLVNGVQLVGRSLVRILPPLCEVSATLAGLRSGLARRSDRTNVT
jgi:hypothetical protein